MQNLVGFSDKINDEAYEKFRKRSGKMSVVFYGIVAIVAVVGSVAYGYFSNRVRLLDSLFYGLGIAAIFVAFAAINWLKKKTDSTWDGEVIDKKIERKTEVKRTKNRTTRHHYDLYVLKVRREDGKIFTHSFRDVSTVYDYYSVGDKVRHHKGFLFYEKYDKSKNSQILCVACGTFNDMKNDFCRRCKVPLLK